MEKEAFIKHLHADREQGTGYSWSAIAGQIGYDEAGIYAEKKKDNKKIYIKLPKEEKESVKRERELDEKWRKTRGCTFGDMNYSRHADKEYINDFPCGSKCKKCGTFWID